MRVDTSGVAEARTTFISMYDHFRQVMHRQLPLAGMVLGCCLALGLLYYLTTPSTFTATGALLIDPHQAPSSQQQSTPGDLALDTSSVQTQVEVLKSETITRAVIRKLNLTKDPEFVRPRGMIGATASFLTGLFGSSRTETPEQRERAVIEKFNQARSISRQDLTYVMQVSFRSEDPVKAAQIVNALAEAYVDDQLEAKYQATRRASLWLQDRIKDLQSQALTAERAVADFKEKNNIVDAGGRLMNDQQLAEINSQLVLTRAVTNETKARYDRIQAMMAQEIPDASVADSLNNPVIIHLRSQYLELAQREAIWAQRYGPDHQATVNLRTQMRELTNSIRDEMRKIADSYKNDYEIARMREESIKQSLDEAVSQAQTASEAQIQLRDLQRNAETTRTFYDNFLRRYMEAIQQQSFPISEARLISPATPPLKKSAPHGSIVGLVSLFSGSILAIGAAYLREMSDRVLRTSTQVEDVLHVNCLAVLPALQTRAEKILKGRKQKALPEKRDFDRLSLLRYAVDAPFSRYAEAIRSLKIAADLNGVLNTGKVIGITSTLPNEGKSTIAANLAHLIADAGGRVILVDADLRCPSLSQAYAPQRPGIAEVVSGGQSLDTTILTLPASNLKFLPAGATTKLPHTNEILASSAVKIVFETLRANYDYIITDLSPVAPIVDVRTTGHIIDSYIYTVEWGHTRIDIIRRALSDAPNVYEHLLGVALNKVDTAAQNRYERYHGNHYYRKYYAKYGYVE
ncbi:AAA family ATPase [Beijerinckia indica]|uniref:Lipopolysaccharide biosynthesis protein n=1 Tax=Beijerinckia indica subsp. indica (strain ATCC 9039 / DSM 1715 / NCIMB 8712) TaxID=395963 RepID=B2IJ14_BEII9|nr:AAA family ATPase [Beijerinckia indica]ACB94777.1 lipopolysaccharide biosynthesis protein [Beijerinckia indica subsp. indica ATCC 9039]